MCGIMGYMGPKEATPILLKALKELEYRGYDSAGIAIINSHQQMEIYKKAGKVSELSAHVPKNIKTHIGIGHTRWATHGGISDKNAHPHQVGHLSFIHNGIIENFQELKNILIEKGYKFISETDTEVFGHLVIDCLKQSPDLPTAIRIAFRRIKGTATIVVLNEKNPHELIAIKRGTPLVAATTGEESFIASDPLAILPYTNKILRLKNDEMIIVNQHEIKVFSLNGERLKVEAEVFNVQAEQISKGEYPHFMLKEIYEQELALVNTLMPHLQREPLDLELNELKELKKNLEKIDKIYAVACGTAYYACIAMKYLTEQNIRIPVEIDFASEFRYRKPIINEKTLFIAISQSGETADTLAAMEEAKNLGAVCLAICNVRSSSLVNLAHGSIYTNAGPEIGVCSTKAFTTQLLINALLCYELAKIKGKPLSKDYLENLIQVPSHISLMLNRRNEITDIAKKILHKKTFMFIGRGPSYPMALEGALKLKEISYLHAEAHAAGELKHGHIALVDENVVLIGIAPQDTYLEKTISNIIEVKSRGATILTLGTNNNTQLKNISHYYIDLPLVDYRFQNLITVIPLQLLAYELALLLNRDIDQPRNLAKSVTVE